MYKIYNNNTDVNNNDDDDNNDDNSDNNSNCGLFAWRFRNPLKKAASLTKKLR